MKINHLFFSKLAGVFIFSLFVSTSVLATNSLNAILTLPDTVLYGTVTPYASHVISWSDVYKGPEYVLQRQHEDEGWTTVGNNINDYNSDSDTLIIGGTQTVQAGKWSYRLARLNLINVSGILTPIYTAFSAIKETQVLPHEPTINLYAGAEEDSVYITATNGHLSTYLNTHYIIGEKLQGASEFSTSTIHTESNEAGFKHSTSARPAGTHQYKIKSCHGVAADDFCSPWSDTLSYFVPGMLVNLSLPGGDIDIDGDIAITWDIQPSATYIIEYEELDYWGNPTWEVKANTIEDNYTLTGFEDGNYEFRIKVCSTAEPDTCSAYEYVSVAVDTPAPYFRQKTPIDPTYEPNLDDNKYWGVTAGTFTVGKDGTANYSLPIEMPSGINGVQPALSLMYNSNAGTGLVGRGWSIGGLSKITRCAASLIRDGYVDGTDYGDDYKFCIDGERLIEVANEEYRTESESFAKIVPFGSVGGSPAGWTVYKRDGSIFTYGDSGNSTRQEFSRIYAYEWHLRKVEDLSGNYMLYSYEKDHPTGLFLPSTIEYTKNDSEGGTNHKVEFVFSNRADDASGYYAQSLQTMDKRLNGINVYSDETLQHAYNLDYDPYSTTYLPGYKGNSYNDKANISKISSITHCYTDWTGNVCADPVTFDWLPSGHSEAVDVDSINVDMDRIKGMYITLLNGAADVDGDGRNDLIDLFGVSCYPERDDAKCNSVHKVPVYFANEDGGFSSETFSYSGNRYVNTTTIIDIDNDGKADLLGMTSGVGASSPNSYDNATILVYRSNGDSFEEPEDWLPSADFYREWSDNKGHNKSVVVDRHFTDVNGDGLIDLVVSGNGVAHNVNNRFSGVFVYLNLGDHFDTIKRKMFDAGGYLGGYDSKDKVTRLMDFNGDNLPDLWFLSDNDIYVAINDGTEFVSPEKIGLEGNSIEGSSTYNEEALGDVNGDGLVDVVRKDLNNDLVTYINTGGSLKAETAVDFDSPCSDDNKEGSPDATTLRLVDINNDSRADLIISCETSGDFLRGSNADEHYIRMSVNNDFAEAELWATNYGQPSSYMITDFSGDGIADIFQLGVYAEDSAILNITKGSYNRVLAINEGTARTINIDYAPMTDGDVLKDNGNLIDIATADPLTRLSKFAGSRRLTGYSANKNGGLALTTIYGVVPANIISEVTTTYASGDYRDFKYEYWNHRYQPGGYGSLGFSKIVKTEYLTDDISDSAPRKETTTTYSQAVSGTYWVIGKPTSISKSVSAPVGDELRKISMQLNNWEVRYWTDDNDSNGFDSPHFQSYLATITNFTYNYDTEGDNILSRTDTRYRSDGSDECDVNWNWGSLVAYSSNDSKNDIYDDHGNLLWSKVSSCDANNTLVRFHKILNNDFDADIDTSSKRVFGLVGKQTKITKVFDNGTQTDATTRIGQRNYNNDGWLINTILEPDTDDAVSTTYSQFNGYGSAEKIEEEWTNRTNDGLDFNNRTTTTTEAYAANGDRTVTISLDVELVDGTTVTHVSTSVYDGLFGTLQSSTDSEGNKTWNQYDAKGRLSSVTRPSGANSAYNYRECHYCFPLASPDIEYYIEEKTTGESVKRSFFDAMGRVIATTTIGLTGDIIYTQSEYDYRGRLSVESVPFKTDYFASRYEYDYLDRLIFTQHADGEATEKQYNGLVVTVTNANQQTSISTSNSLGQLITVEDHYGTTISNLYDADSNIVQTDVFKSGFSVSSSTIKLEYDLFGNRILLDDPDGGITTYQFNALGLMSRETDAEGVETLHSFDKKGRKIERIWNAGANNSDKRTTTWLYDTEYRGLLSRLKGFDTFANAFQEDYTYTDTGQPQLTTKTLYEGTYTEEFFYDSFGRVTAHRYPGGDLITGFVYNDYGYQNILYDASGLPNDTDNLQEALADNAWGNVTETLLLNGVSTTSTYTPDNGFVQTIDANKGAISIVNHQYSFDHLGNLQWRSDHRTGITQSFCYDDLNRLTGDSIFTCTHNKYRYDELGNIIQKAFNVMTTSYGENGAGPHALTSATVNGQPVTYSYNNKGQMIQRGSDSILYNDFGKPFYMQAGSAMTAISYGADQKRLARMDMNGAIVKNTLYVGSGYEKVTIDGTVEENYYVGDFAMLKVTDGVPEWKFLHRDHIGSVVAITNETLLSADNDVIYQAFDPWGSILEDKWNGASKLDLETTERGFTNHEHMTEVGLIHMNGRVYDPLIGRFISPDPLIQAPTNTQSFNRYSYVFNNPLSFTDPTGYEGDPIQGHDTQQAMGETLVTSTRDAGGYIGMFSVAGADSFNGMMGGGMNFANEPALNFSGGGGSAGSGALNSTAAAGQNSPADSSDGKSESKKDSAGEKATRYEKQQLRRQGLKSNQIALVLATRGPNGRVWWIGGPADPTVNTIVTDGKGGIKYQLGTSEQTDKSHSRYVIRGIIIHEKLHIKHFYLYGGDPNILLNQKEGLQIQMSAGLKAIIELKAYRVEDSYLRRIQRRVGLSRMDMMLIHVRRQQIAEKINQFKK